MCEDQEKQNLFRIGHGVDEEKTYMFRLRVAEDNFIRDFDTAIEAVRNELEDAGVSRDTIRAVEVRIGGLFIEIKGEREIVAEIEREHKRFWAKHR